MRRLALLVLATTAAVFPAARASAQVPEEHIRDYRVLIVVDPNGALHVGETIDYEFGTTPKHGIFRDVPVRFRYDDRYDRVTPLTVDGVTATGGASPDVKVEHQGSIEHIRIGDPDSTVTGEHTYAIRYTVGGALNGFADHDELYWNAIGPDWGVPIDHVEVTVRTPGAVTQVACFQGPEGSSLPCNLAASKGKTARFAQDGLYPYSGTTVVVGMEKGAVAPPTAILVERFSLARAFAVTPATGSAAGALLLAAIAGFGLLAWRTGRDKRYVGSEVEIAFGNPTGEDQAVPVMERPRPPVEYAPPDDLRPGQIGTLIDEVANPLDVTATIIDLAVRKDLVIEEIPKEGIFGKPDWKLTRLRPDSEGLLTYEKRLFDGLFRDGNEVLLSGLRNTFASRLEGVQDSLYADAMKRKWFTARPDKIRTKWRAIGWLALAAAVAVTIGLAKFTHAALLGLPLVVFGILMIAGSKRMPRRTAAGVAELRRVLGFKRFVDGSEGDRSKLAERENIFSEYLPYAIVFGCTEKWAKVFEDLAILQDTSWYVSPYPFVYANFASSVDGFTVNTAGTITSVPASSGSSGFGGGGFSGGGFGGGGGGSW